MYQPTLAAPGNDFEKGEGLTPSIVAEMAEEAAERISGLVNETPVYESEALSRGGATVQVKDETEQAGGSFKDRGSGSCVSYHFANGEVFFVTTSTGNHGKGVARAARELDAEPEIVLPESATKEKREGILRTGAKLMIAGKNFDQALAHGLALAEEKQGKFVHPYADPLVIAGQGTIGLELLRQTPDMTHLVLPVGGGGMLAGVASVIKEHKENVKIIAAQVEGNTAFVDSLRRGRALQGQPTDSSLEGIAVGSVHPLTFDLARPLVDQTVVVDQKTLYQTIGLIREETGKLLETAGAVSPAAARLVVEKYLLDSDSQLVAVASGANAPKNLAEEVDRLI